MKELVLDPKFTDVLKALGNPEESLEEAVRRYASEQIGERIGKLQREILGYQSEYGMPYEVFYARVTTEEDFVQKLRNEHETWERDFQTWQYTIEELTEWLGRLETISKT